MASKKFKNKLMKGIFISPQEIKSSKRDSETESQTHRRLLNKKLR